MVDRSLGSDKLKAFHEDFSRIFASLDLDRFYCLFG